MPEVQKFVDQFAKIAPQFGGALVTLAKIMIKVANYLAGIFGEDETAVDTNAAGEAQGKYRMNLETGQFEWVKQSQLNKEAEADPFNPNFKGEGLKLKWDGVKTPSDTNAEGNATTAGGMSVNPTILSPLLPTGPAPTIAPLALPGLSSAPSASSGSSQSVDGALASLDALAPKAQKLGLMFDKLAVAGNDAARSKPLAQR